MKYKRRFIFLISVLMVAILVSQMVVAKRKGDGRPSVKEMVKEYEERIREKQFTKKPPEKPVGEELEKFEEEKLKPTPAEKSVRKIVEEYEELIKRAEEIKSLPILPGESLAEKPKEIRLSKYEELTTEYEKIKDKLAGTKKRIKDLADKRRDVQTRYISANEKFKSIEKLNDKLIKADKLEKAGSIKEAEELRESFKKNYEDSVNFLKQVIALGEEQSKKGVRGVLVVEKLTEHKDELKKAEGVIKKLNKIDKIEAEGRDASGLKKDLLEGSQKRFEEAERGVLEEKERMENVLKETEQLHRRVFNLQRESLIKTRQLFDWAAKLSSEEQEKSFEKYGKALRSFYKSLNVHVKGEEDKLEAIKDLTEYEGKSLELNALKDELNSLKQEIGEFFEKLKKLLQDKMEGLKGIEQKLLSLKIQERSEIERILTVLGEKKRYKGLEEKITILEKDSKSKLVKPGISEDEKKEIMRQFMQDREKLQKKLNKIQTKINEDPKIQTLRAQTGELQAQQKVLKAKIGLLSEFVK